jgi:hypothetical protein
MASAGRHKSMNGKPKIPPHSPRSNLIEGGIVWFRSQPRLRQASYVCALLGALLSVHDFHHPRPAIGYSTPFLAAAILLFLFGQADRKRR